MAQNDPRLQFMLDEAVAHVDVRAELEKIKADVQAVRAGTVRDAAAAVKAGQQPGVIAMDSVQVVPRVLLKEHVFPHLKIAAFEIRGHAVYEISLESGKAKTIHPLKIQALLKEGLGSAFDEHPCQGWRDEWIKTIWGVWIQGAFKKDEARSFFETVIPRSIEAAFERA